MAVLEVLFEDVVKGMVQIGNTIADSVVDSEAMVTAMNSMIIFEAVGVCGDCSRKPRKVAMLSEGII